MNKEHFLTQLLVEVAFRRVKRRGPNVQQIG